MRGVCALVCVFLVVGGYNLLGEARHPDDTSHPIFDWVAVACALPGFGFLAGAFGYWAFYRTF